MACKENLSTSDRLIICPDCFESWTNDQYEPLICPTCRTPAVDTGPHSEEMVTLILDETRRTETGPIWHGYIEGNCARELIVEQLRKEGFKI